MTNTEQRISVEIYGRIDGLYKKIRAFRRDVPDATVFVDKKTHRVIIGLPEMDFVNVVTMYFG